MSWERRRAFEMSWVINYKGYCMSRRDTVRKSNSFCSRASSAMRRFYLRAFKKTILSLHLSEWLEWKCKNAAQSLGFLCRVVESLWSASCRSSCLVRISVRSIVQRWIWLWVEVSSKNEISQVQVSQMVFCGKSWRRWHMLGKLWFPRLRQQKKNVHMSVKLLFLMMVSSNIRILWWIGASKCRALVCSFV